MALLHDIAITVGVYALTGREVSNSTVAAVLSRQRVSGYSIYDTIIIFDRIRENVQLMRRAPFAKIANVSLWETIRRSLATTLITLLPVARWFLRRRDPQGLHVRADDRGSSRAPTRQSSSPRRCLTIWKEHEPEYARAGASNRRLTAAGASPVVDPPPPPLFFFFFFF